METEYFITYSLLLLLLLLFEAKIVRFFSPKTQQNLQNFHHIFFHSDFGLVAKTNSFFKCLEIFYLN